MNAKLYLSDRRSKRSITAAIVLNSLCWTWSAGDNECEAGFNSWLCMTKLRQAVHNFLYGYDWQHSDICQYVLISSIYKIVLEM